MIGDWCGWFLSAVQRANPAERFRCRAFASARVRPCDGLSSRAATTHTRGPGSRNAFFIVPFSRFRGPGSTRTSRIFVCGIWRLDRHGSQQVRSSLPRLFSRRAPPPRRTAARLKAGDRTRLQPGRDPRGREAPRRERGSEREREPSRCMRARAQKNTHQWGLQGFL